MGTETLEQLLTVLRGESPAAIRRALPDLANRNIVVPVVRFQNLNDPKGTRRIQVVHRMDGDRRLVHVFSSEDFLLQWAGDEVYQCFNVAAGDLALTLPPDSWIVFDVASPRELVLAPEQVQILAWGDPTTPPVGTPTSPTPKVESKTPSGQEKTAPQPEPPERGTAKIASRPDLRNEKPRKIPLDEGRPPLPPRTPADEDVAATNTANVLHGGLSHSYDPVSGTSSDAAHADTPVGLPEVDEDSIPQSARIDFAQVEEILKEDLGAICVRYPVVEEAYLVRSPAHPTTYLLGILARELPPEARFALIEEIALLSRKHLGEAGAIEVYDDLSSSTSRSWELFQTYIPFYVSGTGDEPRSPLIASLELESDSSESGPSDDQSAESPMRRILWGLRKGGSGKDSRKRAEPK